MKPLHYLVVCFLCCLFLLLENRKQLSSLHLSKPVYSSKITIQKTDTSNEDVENGNSFIGNSKVGDIVDNKQYSIHSIADLSNGYNTSVSHISTLETTAPQKSLSKMDNNDEITDDQVNIAEQQGSHEEEERDMEDNHQVINQRIEFEKYNQIGKKEEMKVDEQDEMKDEEKEDEKSYEEGKEDEKSNDEEDSDGQKNEDEHKTMTVDGQKEEETIKEEGNETTKGEEQDEDDETTNDVETTNNDETVQRSSVNDNSSNTIIHSIYNSQNDASSSSDNCAKYYWNCSNFYMHLGTLYSSFTPKSIIQSSKPPLKSHSVYPILTLHLKDETDRILEYSFDDSWKSRFDKLQQEVYSNYLATNTTRYDEILKSSYSHIVVKKALDSRSGWILATNICYDRKSKQYNIYSVNGKPLNIRKHGKQFFRFGWHFNYYKARIPEDAMWFKDETVYIAMQFRPKHITHFAESIDLMLLKLLAPSEFPPITNLFMPVFRDFDEYGWSKTYLDLVVNSFSPVQKNITVYKQEQLLTIMRKKSARMICFPSAVLMDRMAYNNDGGIFAGFFSADWMRVVSYKHANVSFITNKKKLELGILERHTDRKWINLARYLRHLHEHFDDKVNIHQIEMFGKTYDDQVREFYTDDIILGGHGSAMANVFFMRPRSVLIECNPPFFFEMCFANIAYISRVHYISVTNYDTSKTDFTPKKANRLYDKGTFFRYRRQFARYSIYPSVLSVVSAVSDAVDFVDYSRCTYSNNDIWSRVFIQ